LRGEQVSVPDICTGNRGDTSVAMKLSRYRPCKRYERVIELLLILDLGTRWGEMSASHPGRALLPERTPPPQYPLDKRLGGLQSWSGHTK
jgi:hypothetical protein